MYEVPAGGRRYRALERLVKAKRLAKTAPVPCIVKEDGIAEEDSLAENTQREALHPIDQFRAFRTLIDKGLSEEEIAARFFVTPAVVKQRLRLAAVSEKLIDAYIAEEMTLEQLMAFTVTEDHARQEQVWEAVQQGYNKEAWYIRRLLTESAVSAADRRAVFVGIEAYMAAGGGVTRDLFENDRGGWLQDPALLDRLANEKLKAEAEKLAGEGWKWIAASIDFPYGHTAGLRRLKGEPVEMTEEEEAARAAAVEEFDRLEAEYEHADELPDEVDQRLGELEEMIEGFESRPVRYDPADIARAGAFISLDRDGDLNIERGYVRPEDEAPAPSASDGGAGGRAAGWRGGRVRPSSHRHHRRRRDGRSRGRRGRAGRHPAPLGPARRGTHRAPHARAPRCGGERAGSRLPVGASCALPRRLLPLRRQRQLHGNQREERELRRAGPVAQGQRFGESNRGASRGLAGAPAGSPGCPVGRAHRAGQRQPGGALRALRLAHGQCGAGAVEPASERACLHGEQLARAVGLDMVAAGWKPTVDNYLGRVPKARILEAVREGRDERSAQLIDHLKKGEMAKEAQRLLDGSGWLPEPLRPADPGAGEAGGGEAGEAPDLPAFLAGDDAEEDAGEAADEEELIAAE